ncbi:acyl-CoA dehydrogenase family protein [Streptomyces sp. NPDC005775]|uniref:acyl-CoA dehydrogenase family protein n=1 Tax=Streptomyces sp. NPDC005775 TaxID=3364729 RepID=UPI0036B1F4F3
MRTQLAGLDENLLALPLYEDHHRFAARRLAGWCQDRAELWEVPTDRAPDVSGLRILRALGADGWLAFLDPDAPSSGEAAASGDGTGTAPGLNGDFRSLCLAREVLAYADDLADFTFSIQALAATPIIRYGTEEQKRRYLPPMARGELAGSFAVTEEASGSDLAAVGLRAERVPGGYVLDGEKAWIANSGIAGVHCVIARTGEGPGALGLTAFLVPAETGGLSCDRSVRMVAPRSLGHLVLDRAFVPDTSVLGRPGHGFVIASDVLERFRMTVGAAAVGFARRAADAAVGHARERKIYRGSLFDLPSVKAALADSEVALNGAALLVARAAWEIDHGRRGYPRHSSIAKLAATESAQRIVDATVQIFGAAGLVADSVPERLYRQIRSLRIYEGASEVQQMIIAGSLDRKPVPPRAPASADAL